MSLTEGMNLEASATGKDIAQVQKAPIQRRLVMAPIGLVAAEIGAQIGVYAENVLADFFMDAESGKKKKKADDSWRTKVLLGKVVLAVLLYPISAPLALGFAASGGILHWIVGLPTFAECEDQANRRGKQLLKLGEKPKGRYTRKPKGSDEEKQDEAPEKDSEDDKEAAQAEETNIDLAAKLTDPDVLHTYGKAAEMAFDRLVQQGHLPPGTKPVLNEALVQEVQGLVRDAQSRAA